MPFQKGNELGKSNKGHPYYPIKDPARLAERNRKIGEANRGKKVSEETRIKQSIAAKRRGFNGTIKGKLIPCSLCEKEVYKYPRDMKRVKVNFCSKKCWYTFSDTGKTTKNERIRDSKEYKEWRMAVFRRDNFTCVLCGLKNRKGLGYHVTFDADHIKPFSLYPELRLQVSNGRTLCRPCHLRTDTWGNNMHRYKKELLKT